MTFLRRCLIVAAPILIHSALAIQGLTVSLSGPDTVQALSRIVIVAEIRNTGEKPVCLVNDPNSLVSDLPTDKFRVIKEDEMKVPIFKGIRVKFVPRRAATKRDCTLISPGESISVPHDVYQIYDFSISGQGTYTFSPAYISFLALDGEQISRINAQVHAISVLVSGVITSTIPLSRVINYVGEGNEPSFIRCTREQQTKIKLALAATKSYATATYAYLEALHSFTKRFQEWFGEPDEYRLSIVHSHFEDLTNANFMSFTYDCTCNIQSVFAYVWPSKYGSVHICTEFWEAPCTGTDSQAGTLLHEASHFQRNGGTFDYAYGQDDSKQLALDEPYDAIMNADSHEYFAENPDMTA